MRCVFMCEAGLEQEGDSLRSRWREGRGEGSDQMLSLRLSERLGIALLFFEIVRVDSLDHIGGSWGHTNVEVDHEPCESLAVD